MKNLKNKNNEDKKDLRTRNYATVIYEESAPDKWQEILAEQLVPAFISPYHDKDINPTGEPKKPHWHVMIMFDNKKSIEQAKNIFDLIGGVGCEIVQSLRGYARYLCHLDNPEKVQYDIDGVRSLCGADYVEVIGLAVNKYKAVREMIAWCDDHNVYSYSALLRYASFERSDWFRILCDCATIVMREYFMDKRVCAKEERERKLYEGTKPDKLPKLDKNLIDPSQLE